MNILGTEPQTVLELIRALSGENLTPDEVNERFARATWTGLVDPGDRFAGLLIGRLGAARALAVVIDEWPVDRILAAVIEAAAEGGIRASSVDDLQSVSAELATALDRWRPRIQSEAILHQLRQAVRLNVHLLIPGDPAWPAGFDDLGLHAPLALWLRGNESTLATASTSIALVGARAATGYGEQLAVEVASDLVARGYTIVSGAAYGIDGAAHRGALASGGQTIAFLAGGVDRFYPAGHDALLGRIAQKGAVVSELPCGTPPTKWRFPLRNRLIAAASQATVVIEAGWVSGTLNTANHAAQLGRPLGAVPGPVTSPASAGCHRLLRENDAICVTNADEMAELAPIGFLGSAGDWGAVGPGAGVAARVSPDSIRVIDAISARSPRTVDDIAARSGLAVRTVQSVLGLLELEGRATARERGWVRGPARPTG